MNRLGASRSRLSIRPRAVHARLARWYSSGGASGRLASNRVTAADTAPEKGPLS